MPTSAEAWTAVKTRSGQERRAAHNVEALGFPFLLLEFRVPCANPIGYRRSLLFPGYLLVLVRRTNDNWSVLFGTRGIAHVFLSDGRPCRIPEREVVDLVSRRDADGFVVLPDRLLPSPPLCLGEKVRVDKDGHSLFGRRGIFRGSTANQRCRVLFQMMGRAVEVTMPEADLARA